MIFPDKSWRIARWLQDKRLKQTDIGNLDFSEAPFELLDQVSEPSKFSHRVAVIHRIGNHGQSNSDVLFKKLLEERYSKKEASENNDCLD